MDLEFILQNSEVRDALLSMGAFFTLMTFCHFALGRFGKNVAHILNFPIWYYIMYVLESQLYWFGVIGYFLFHVVLDYAIEAFKKARQKPAEQNV